LDGQAEPTILNTIDAPARVKMSQRVQAGVFRRAAFRCDAGRYLRRHEAALHDVRMVLHSARPGREYEPGFALRAPQLPFSEGVEKKWRNGKITSARWALGPTDGVESIRTLSDMQRGFLQVHVFPSQTAQFRRPKPGKDRGEEQGPPATVEIDNDRPDFL